MPLGELPDAERTCDNCECRAWLDIAECHEQRENGGVCPTWTESTESLRARAEQRIADLERALSDLLTGIDVHNERVAGSADIPVPRIEGPIVDAARKVLKGGA